jgi:Uma2 family endonuclease
MTPATTQGLPTHKDLPDSDGAIVENYQESPQNTVLTGCLRPRLRELCPDGRFSIGRDNGIYWRQTDPPLDGCKSPDFFIVIGVEPMLEGEIRRSYVLWQERVHPLLIAEYVSGTGAEEHDATPNSGKFWVYEQQIKARYYLIFDGWRRTLEAYLLDGTAYRRLTPNAAGRYPVPELRVEFGLWDGEQEEMNTVWLRVWDATSGQLLPTYEEAQEQQRQRAEAEQQRAEAAEGIVDDLRREADEQTEHARQERREREEAEARAAQERERAEQAQQKAAQAEQRAARLAELIRQLGGDPDAA